MFFTLTPFEKSHRGACGLCCVSICRYSFFGIGCQNGIHHQVTDGLRRWRFSIHTESDEEDLQITSLSPTAFDVEIHCLNRIQQSVVQKLVYKNLLKQMTQTILLPQPPWKPDPGWVGVNTYVQYSTAKFSQIVAPVCCGHSN